MKQRAFTLIELLVVVAIIGILAGLLLPVIGSLQRSANKTREISAGRQLAVAYVSSAQDDDGSLMIGYASNAAAWDDLGRPVPNPICNRYPWRLAKYLGYKIVGTLLVNEQAKIADLRDQQATYNYMVSLAPTFGMNSIMIGGNYQGAYAPSKLMINKYGKYCVTRMGEAATPGRLILFASAHYVSEGQPYLGYHTVEPPYLKGSNWGGAYQEDSPQSLGYIHLRYDRKAVVIMLDGHAETLGEEELRDMRRWSNQAADADNKDYVLGNG